MHELAYEAALRHIGQLSHTASLSMRESAGYSTKSSLSHTWSFDTRDDKAIATQGVLLRTYQELAGLGGDVSFLKSQCNFHVSRPFFSSVLSLSCKTGLLYPLQDTVRPPLFSDKFQLGGPLDIRIFKQNGLGPRDNGDSLGGDLYWAAGLSLISNLPLKPHWPVKTHAFVNAGRLDTHTPGKSIADNIRDCVSKPSISAGVGLLYRLDPVRIEINFGVPLVASKSDGYRRGFHLGIGVDFL